MDKIDSKIKLFKDILIFTEECSFGVKTFNFNKKKEAVYVFAYKERILSLGKSCLILLENKKYIEIQILSRCALEALFYFISLIKDQKFLKVIIKDHTKQKIKMFGEILDNKKISSEFNFSKEYLENCMDELGKEIEEYESLEDMITKKSAEKAELASMYTSTFRLLSLAVHSKAKILEEQFNFSKGCLKFKQKQGKENVHSSVDGLIAVFLMMASYLVDYVEIDDKKIKNKIRTFCCRYEKFNKN